MPGDEKMKMLHVTIHTRYFEETIRFYEEHAGLHIQRDLREAGRNIVFLAEKEGDTQIELIDDPTVEKAGNEYLSIGFNCGDPEHKRERMSRLGFDVTPMQYPAPGVGFFYVKDPAGVKVQFM